MMVLHDVTSYVRFPESLHLGSTTILDFCISLKLGLQNSYFEVNYSKHGKQTRGSVFKETVVLCRWGSMALSTELISKIGHHSEIES